MIENFFGNRHVVRALEGMIAREQITQTMLFSGPEGIGKATLARRFASLLLPHAELIERDDLSHSDNVKTIADREKWTADKRNEDPLLFASQADFLTFTPDGPLRQITIAQMRALKERAQFLPNQGKYRVFLIDHIDRANEQAANSLLKILEEPPPYLILIATAENAYDLLPTIRSRSVLFPFSPLSPEDMRAFAASRELADAERRITLAAGSPGLALTMDLELFAKRRAAMLLLLSVAAGLQPFAKWIPVSESIGRSKNEKMDIYLKLLYELLRDVMLLNNGGPDGARPIRNVDVKSELTAIAAKFPAQRVVRVVPKIDAVLELVRRNIQKVIALDHLLLELSSNS